MMALDGQGIDAGTPVFDCHVSYEVSTRPSDLGRVLAVRSTLGEGTLGTPPNEGLCWEIFEQQSAPCPGCPILKPVVGAVRLLVGGRHAEGRYALSTVEVGQGVLRVFRHCVDDRILDALISARIDDVADQGHLSAQERAVFEHLCLGRQFKEIAVDMGLSPRTVKFHATNAFKKIGVDSRVSLLRFLLKKTARPDDAPNR